MANDKKARILFAALECISQKGYAGTRLADVGAIAGVSVGLIQHYYGTRQQLLDDALLYASNELVIRFKELARSERRPWSRIRGMVELLCHVPNLPGQTRMWLELTGLVTKRHRLQSEMARVYSAWDQHVREAVEQGTAEGSLDPSGTTDDVVAVFLAFFEGYEFEIATNLVSEDPRLLEQRALMLARLLFRPVDGLR